jgi:ketosteroid isomerase-like protein
MAAADVELVKELLERWRAKDQGLDLIHPEVEWDASDFPDGEVYRGHAGVARFVGRWVNLWDKYEVRAEELIDEGEFVVALVHERGRSRDGIEVTLESLLAFWWRDGQLVRFRGYIDRTAGMKALGLQNAADRDARPSGER